MQCFFCYRIFLSLDLLVCLISSEVHFSVVAIPHLDLLSVQPCQQAFLLKTDRHFSFCTCAKLMSSQLNDTRTCNNKTSFLFVLSSFMLSINISPKCNTEAYYRTHKI